MGVDNLVPIAYEPSRRSPYSILCHYSHHRFRGHNPAAVIELHRRRSGMPPYAGGESSRPCPGYIVSTSHLAVSRLGESSNPSGTSSSNLRNHLMPPWSRAACREPANTVGMARTFLPGLPDKRDQAVPDSLRIGFVARQCSPQELFLDQDPHHERPDGNAGQQSRGVRFQPQRHADQ